MKTNLPLFIADVHVGRLARLLRMLGFDTLYSNTFSNADLVNAALSQHRILLTRNAAAGRHQPELQTFMINKNDPAAQLADVLRHFNLLPHIQSFSRCMVCNGLLEPVAKAAILNELPEKTALYFNEFWQCTRCKRVYWKGPHYNRMLQFIQKMQSDNAEGTRVGF